MRTTVTNVTQHNMNMNMNMNLFNHNNNSTDNYETYDSLFGENFKSCNTIQYNTIQYNTTVYYNTEMRNVNTKIN